MTNQEQVLKNIRVLANAGLETDNVELLHKLLREIGQSVENTKKPDRS